MVFNPFWQEEGSYIECVDAGETMWVNKRNGFYVLDTKDAPTNEQTVAKTSMFWQAGAFAAIRGQRGRP